ncbi:ribonuclease kappa [Ditylenchus destructor]|nr:ribonuclease kappa [Ditylenchus destructor]
MKKLCPLCGPKLSAFCMVMSVWGVIFLGLLGVFFYIQAVTLFPDLHFHEHEDITRSETIELKYQEKAVQCWIAAGMYIVTLIIVFWQNKFNTAQVF